MQLKIGIIGDVHLGASYSLGKKDHSKGINSRLVDYDITLIETIKDMAAQGCKHLIFTGDIFEHRTPSVKQQELFSAALKIALDLGIEEIHIVVGNHDQQRITRATTISYIKELQLSNIHVYDEIDMVTVHDDDGEALANLIFMPYRDRKWFETDSAQQAINEVDEMLSYHLGSIDNDAKKILVGHMVVEGTMWMLDEYADLYESNDLILPRDMFRSIDVTVMGHVHTPGLVCKNPFIYYVGSMEKRGAFEAHDKKYVIIDLETKSFKPHNEPCRNLYDIKMDFSNLPQGEKLMGLIIEHIDEFAKDKEMASAIVRVMVSISADDDKFCNPKEIEEYLRAKYNVEHCVEIKPSLLFSRQARDSQINEHASDTESFSKYINKAFRDSEIKDEILSLGLDIIRAEEV